MKKFIREAIWVLVILVLVGSNVATIAVYGLIDAKTDCQQELVRMEEENLGLLQAKQITTEPSK